MYCRKSYAQVVRGESYMKYLSSTLIRYVTSTYSAHAPAPAMHLSGLPPNRLRFILDRIHTNIHTRLFSRDLAKLVRIESAALRQSLPSKHRTSTYQVHSLRTHRAGEASAGRDADAIMDIAIEVGFAHHSHFGDAFRHLTGMTPKQYRQLYESFHTPAKLDCNEAA